MLLHVRKAHPGVEVEKFSRGPKPKPNTGDGDASASRRSTLWYHRHKDSVLSKRKQAIMTGGQRPTAAFGRANFETNFFFLFVSSNK
jgi:hypothetical protein